MPSMWGSYSCHGTGTCFANEGDVPGCTLPWNADEWMCCPSSTCSVTGSSVCQYRPPEASQQPPPPPPPTGNQTNAGTNVPSWVWIVIACSGLIFCVGTAVVVTFLVVRKRSSYATVA
mmetsp:Transcript_22330/g.28517  ORF Transcript_22330/g.28517 Transcript_22330/m.28517 type:complete len:118 (-) Transcript_22330:41-394(-)